MGGVLAEAAIQDRLKGRAAAERGIAIDARNHRIDEALMEGGNAIRLHPPPCLGVNILARAHADFLGDPTPTDVITFQHGEILISTETAIRQAAEHSHPPLRECALYLIHGLLHLHGHEDHEPAEAEAMKETQERILDRVWPAA